MLAAGTLRWSAGALLAAVLLAPAAPAYGASSGDDRTARTSEDSTAQVTSPDLPAPPADPVALLPLGTGLTLIGLGSAVLGIRLRR